MPYKVSPLRTVWRDEAAGFGLAATGLGFGFGAAALVTAGFGLATAVDGDVRGGCGRVFSTVVVEETGRDGVAVGTAGAGVLETSTGASGSGSRVWGCDERRHCEGLSAHASM